MWIIGKRLARAAFPAEHDRDLLVAVPRRAPQRRDVRRRQRAQIAPCVRRKVVSPDRRIVQINLAPPLPAVAAAEGGEADVTRADRVENVLRVAADARWRRVRFL